MITKQINAYSYGANTLNSTGDSGSSNSASSTKKKSSLGINDFMKLLSAQMANQDPMSPTDNTEFIAQMAQFSSLTAMQELTKTATSQLSAIDTASLIAYSNYGATLVGKTVEVKFTNEDGTTGTAKGVVSSVNFLNNSNTVTIDGKDYDLSSVTKVVADSSK